MERARLPRSRRLRLRHHAVQFHVDRRQPADGPGDHGVYGGLETLSMLMFDFNFDGDVFDLDWSEPHIAHQGQSQYLIS